MLTVLCKERTYLNKKMNVQENDLLYGRTLCKGFALKAGASLATFGDWMLEVLFSSIDEIVKKYTCHATAM